jgi:hypothetical protein
MVRRPVIIIAPWPNAKALKFIPVLFVDPTVSEIVAVEGTKNADILVLG